MGGDTFEEPEDFRVRVMPDRGKMTEKYLIAKPESPLTTEEMARYLKCSLKTFRKTVRDHAVPYIPVGNRKRWDPEKVIEHLTTSDPSLRTKTISKKKTELSFPVRGKSEFSGILG
ncbi:MAG: helix-turn-helix domain-containing protein [Pyrinomonadaceae bacterium]|nr:helix-turn-helix domain-containing protein [Pyrinomonadaceae bacterium]